mmetsp:Transcript_15764/g.23697  ORF Transcript_15764/g.23697 Transcript_15764/m.23697 type:complete len:405 (+) Transcript_15764:255-1469(+)|eukprot:CAMPEP_0185040984 /NCGR_PEP_ID=MMETSP1103-20130426/39733_1 /TAXON_ID=36769 /ORGANISM="Paraphysomonas bandaiensis, Strain Caron Lab Isolate" /LENGTH=404 /DNA_ID=CAMNT_0027580537 /DNA_START=195 /DNA_END=1409 /DNA_ORIENTATION=+
MIRNESCRGVMKEDESFHETLHHSNSIRGSMIRNDSFRGAMMRGESTRGKLKPGNSIRGTLTHGDSFRGGMHRSDSLRGRMKRTDSLKGAMIHGDSIKGVVVHGDSVRGKLKQGESFRGGLEMDKLFKGRAVDNPIDVERYEREVETTRRRSSVVRVFPPLQPFKSDNAEANTSHALLKPAYGKSQRRLLQRQLSGDDSESAPTNVECVSVHRQHSKDDINFAGQANSNINGHLNPHSNVKLSPIGNDGSTRCQSDTSTRRSSRRRGNNVAKKKIKPILHRIRSKSVGSEVEGVDATSPSENTEVHTSNSSAQQQKSKRTAGGNGHRHFKQIAAATRLHRHGQKQGVVKLGFDEEIAADTASSTRAQNVSDQGPKGKAPRVFVGPSKHALMPIRLGRQLQANGT